jgi:small basic protein
MPARSPSKLGLTLTFCLLIGLLLWRLAFPGATPWLDIAALVAVALLLTGIRAFLNKKR